MVVLNEKRVVVHEPFREGERIPATMYVDLDRRGRILLVIDLDVRLSEHFNLPSLAVLSPVSAASHRERSPLPNELLLGEPRRDQQESDAQRDRNRRRRLVRLHLHLLVCRIAARRYAGHGLTAPSGSVEPTNLGTGGSGGVGSLERRENPDGEVRPAAAFDQLDQCVQVVTGVVGELGRQRGRESSSSQLFAAPAPNLVDRCGASCFGLHDFFVPPRGPSLTARPAGLAKSRCARGRSCGVTRALAEQVLASALSRRRATASEAWDLDHEIVLVGAGDRVAIPGRYDRTYPFRAHSEYLYLTDRERPNGVLAFDPSEGWTEFLSPVTREELLWEALDGVREGVPEGARSVLELEALLDARQGRRCGCLGAPIEGVECDPLLTQDLRDVLTALRRVKDEVELERMTRAEQATRAGFLALPALIDAGRTEREIQIELEAEFFRHGADFLAFDTIIAAGDHSAIFHFAPTSRRLARGELLLVDAGGEVRGYASDVTRTYPVSGAFTAEQAALYEIVREALRAATATCRPGAEWRDVHLAAALAIGEGLVDLGLLRGEPASLFERGAMTLFFPHGVGHMVGLGVRDAGGVVPDRPPPGNGFPRLRVDLPLRAGYAMTVEPGIYFVARLLEEPETRAQLRDCVDWDTVDHFLGFGGVRLEDNVLVTEEGCEVITRHIPFVGETLESPTS